MTNFILNAKKTLKNHLQDRTIQDNFVGKQNTLTSKIFPPNTFVLNNNNSSKELISQIDGTRAKPLISTIQGNNYSKIIRIRRDTTPVRTNLYDYINSVFRQPVLVDTFKFCSEQKISTVFATHGDVQWFSTFNDKQPSYKTAIFNRILYNPLSLQEDCSCRIFNFNGIYTLDRTLPNFNSLITTSNKDISKVSFEFDPSQSYIIMSFYSTKTNSYAKIKLRPPIRYRPIYNDWVFDESVTIDNIMSLTEYAEIIDCCQPFSEGNIH